MTITEFLEARIAEDEAAAKAADSGRWLPEDKGVTFEFFGEEFPEGEAQSRLTADTKANMNHIARHDPARVLAECAAKRAIIGLHPVYIYTDDEPGFSMELSDHVCPIGAPTPVVGPCKTLRALAAVYKDHNDYQEAWG